MRCEACFEYEDQKTRVFVEHSDQDAFVWNVAEALASELRSGRDEGHLTIRIDFDKED